MTSRLVLPLGAVLAAFVALAAVATRVGSQDGSESAVRALHDVFDADWERALRENPTWASSLGDRRYNDRWPDRTLDAIERSHQETIRTLARLEAIDRSQLPAPEQLNYDLFRGRVRDEIEGHRFRGFLLALDQRRGSRRRTSCATASTSKRSRTTRTGSPACGAWAALWTRPSPCWNRGSPRAGRSPG
jgi:Uncharacterized protein conserved in bacteria